MSIRAMTWAVGAIEELDDISSKAAHVVVTLAWFHNQETGRCDPSIARIVERTKLSERTVRTAIRELEALRLIQTIHRKSRTGKGTKNLNNRYKFNRLGGGAPVAGRVGHQLPGKRNLGGAMLLPSTYDDLAMMIDSDEGAE